MNEKEFWQRLSDLGFRISVRFANGSSEHAMYLNGIMIDKSEYVYFGRECLGTYNQCSTIKDIFDENDIQLALQSCSRILMKEIKYLHEQPDYWDCRDFLLQDKYAKTNVEKSSIRRTLNILKDDFQDLMKSVKKFDENDNN